MTLLLCRLVAACVAALALASSASAGGWRGRPHRAYTEAEYHLNHIPVPTLSKDKMPKEFSWANARGRHLLVPSWNQHEPVYCGSCFAHATLSMISDRLKIAKNGAAPDVMLSRQTFLNCAGFKGFGDGCDGGDVSDVFGYMSKFGLPDESCLTYDATDHTKFGDKKKIKECPAAGLCRNCMPVNGSDTCWAVKTPILYFLESFGRVGSKSYEVAEEEGGSPAAASSKNLPPKNKRGASNELAMMSELFQRGPIVCSISTPDDFVYEYRGGVYVDRAVNASRDDVDHDVEVVGWGTEDDDDENGENGQGGGLDYWIVRNSWGTFWGELGFFRVQRGVNALYIEDGDCWYAQPEHGMEARVRRGELSGSMFGVVDAEGAGGKKKRRKKTALSPSSSSSSSSAAPRVDVA